MNDIAGALRELAREAAREAVREVLAEQAKAATGADAAVAAMQPNYTDAELCKRWKKSRTWLRAVRAAGELRSTAFGGRHITSAAEVLRAEREGFSAIGTGGRPKSVVRPLFGGAKP